MNSKVSEAPTVIAKDKKNDFVINIKNLVNILHIAQLNEEQIITNLKSATNYRDMWVEYIQGNSGLAHLACYSIFFDWIKQYLNEHIHTPAVKDMYQYLFNCWFNKRYQLLKSDKLIGDSDDNFIEHCWVYTHAVALKLKEEELNDTVLSVVNVMEEVIISGWQRFFSNESQTFLIAQCCPWQVEKNGRIWLYHQDIVNYFATSIKYDLKCYLYLPFIRGNEGVERLSLLLNKQELIANSKQINHLVADILVGDIAIDDYFKLIYLSAKSENFKLIAANAITVLNYSKVSMYGKDLSGIRIPGADLSDILMDSVSLKYSDLNYTNLQHSTMRNVDLTGSNMLEVNLEEEFFLEGENGRNDIWTHFSRIAFSPIDENKLVVINDNGSVMFYHLDDQKKVKLGNQNCPASELVFDTNGSMLVIGGKNLSSREPLLMLCKVDTHEIILQADIPEIPSIDVYHIVGINYLSSVLDAELIIVSTSNNTAWIYYRNMNRFDKLPPFESKITFIRLFSDKTSSLVITTDKREIFIYSIENKSILKKVFDDNDIVYANISYDSKFLITGSNHNISVWLLPNIDLYKKVTNIQIAAITALCLDPLVKFAAIGYSNNVICIQDIESGDIIEESIVHDDFKMQVKGIRDLMFNCTGNVLAAVGWDNTVRFIEMNVKKFNMKAPSHKSEINSVAFCSVYRIVVTADAEGYIYIWCADNGNLLYRYKVGAISLTTTRFLDNSSMLIIGDTKGNIQLIDLSPCGVQCNIVFPFKYPNKINSIAINKDLQIMAVGGQCNEGDFQSYIQIWKIADKKIMFTFNDLVTIKCLEFSNSGQVLISGHKNKELRFWDIHRQLNILTVTSGAKNLDVSDDFWRKIYRVHTGKLIELENFHKDFISDIRFHPTEPYLATASWDRTIKLWKITQNSSNIELVKTFIGHDHYVISIDFDKNARWLVSGGTDGKICIWDINDRKELLSTIAHQGSINKVCFSDKEGYLYTGSSDHCVRGWRIRTDGKDTKLELLWTSRSRFTCEGTIIEKTTLLAKHARLFKQRGAKGEPQYVLNPELVLQRSQLK